MAGGKEIDDVKSCHSATGPTSAKGREQVSKNALIHGLTAERWLVLPEESR